MFKLPKSMLDEILKKITNTKLATCTTNSMYYCSCGDCSGGCEGCAGCTNCWGPQ